MDFVLRLLKMNSLEEFEYINNLYAIYKDLLTDKQKELMDSYYLYNLSYQEISDNFNISKNGVYDSINHSVKKLYDFEDKLKLFKKKERIEDILKNEKDSKIKEEIMGVIDNGIWKFTRKVSTFY